jgi:phage gp16-like protein
MSQALLAKIHIAKKQLGLEEDLYRSILSDVTQGKTSCSEMTGTELQAVLAHFVRSGFVPKKAKKSRRLSPPSGTAKIAEIDKIRAIWITMAQQGIVRDSSEPALDAYVKRMTSKLNNGNGIAAVAWLTAPLAISVLEALKNWHRRILADRLSSIGVTVIEQHQVTKPVHQAAYYYVLSTFKFYQKRGKL